MSTTTYDKNILREMRRVGAIGLRVLSDPFADVRAELDATMDDVSDDDLDAMFRVAQEPPDRDNFPIDFPYESMLGWLQREKARRGRMTTRELAEHVRAFTKVFGTVDPIDHAGDASGGFQDGCDNYEGFGYVLWAGGREYFVTIEDVTAKRED